MNLMFDFLDWFLSFSLLAGAVLGIWLCAVVIGEQNHLTETENDVDEEMVVLAERFRHHWGRLRNHWRR